MSVCSVFTIPTSSFAPAEATIGAVPERGICGAWNQVTAYYKLQLEGEDCGGRTWTQVDASGFARALIATADEVALHEQLQSQCTNALRLFQKRIGVRRGAFPVLDAELEVPIARDAVDEVGVAYPCLEDPVGDGEEYLLLDRRNAAWDENQVSRSSCRCPAKRHGLTRAGRRS